jgi:hypothetical protein
MRSTEDIVSDLIGVLRSEAQALLVMQTEMGNTRTAFVSLKASPLQAGIDAVSGRWNAMLELEVRREALLEEFRELTGSKGRLRVSTIAPHLPRNLAMQLRAAGDEVDRAARRVRAETTASTKLLRLSRVAHESLVRALTGAEGAPARGYDKNARTVGPDRHGGRLITGTA